ncbi:hypothetical protein [Natronosalvus halobius]|uniref:hypothetical protein n=1 Tax=Natronosalvus halobius TaxID=2953746 RepID=UPI00209F51E2|nr:hypothetical protein [Natronosalvus halobius]USZ72035.1 hypothetical protein NGM15_01625 [Natronosalvus halobius]
MDGPATGELERAAVAYEEYEPFATVENDRLETLPAAFADGSFLWKDVEWVVRWYSRRTLSNEPHPAESAFRENEWDEVETAIETAVSAAKVDATRANDTSADDRRANDTSAALEALTALEGVDVPVASAFLHYVDPERYLVVDQQLWTVMAEHASLEAPPPDPIDVEDYRRYLECCRELAREHDLGLVSLYRALWRLGNDGLA